MKTYTNPVYPYRRRAEQDGSPHHCGVAVVGAGPVGLVTAIDLAGRGVPVVLLDEDDTVSVGSRAICWSKRTLEILDRLGCGEPLVQKGVRWSVGKVFHRDALVYQFDLLAQARHKRPAFVNLQQYHVEECLVGHACASPNVDLRWKNRVVAVSPREDRVELRVECPDGDYGLTCDWLIAADGAKSAVRHLLGLESAGQVFHDRFLIADIHMRSNFPPERWFWFDPPFHPGQSVLLHRQADDVWRIDFQLGSDADPEEEKKLERIVPRLRAMLGDTAQFELEWASVYTFSCRRLSRFRHGHVLFVGDAAHVVSPFGARGGNSGIQDADNLVWKLDLVMRGKAREALLDTYDDERCAAADENMKVTTRSTDFISPKSAVSRTFRNAVLGLARKHSFARQLVNSGRLSVPHVHADSALNTPDQAADRWKGTMAPGAPAADAPVHGPRGTWLLDHLGGDFALLVFGSAPEASTRAALMRGELACRVWVIAPEGDLVDIEGVAAERYDARPGTCYLLRPDQIVCARWRRFDLDQVREALQRATMTLVAVEAT